MNRNNILIMIGIVILGINIGCNKSLLVTTFTMTPIKSDTIEFTNIIQNSTYLTPEIYSTVTNEPTITYTPTHTALPINTGGGGKIAYTHYVNGLYSDLFVYNFSLSKEITLLVGYHINNYGYSWSIDGKYILLSIVSGITNENSLMGLDILNNKLWTIYSSQIYGLSSPSWSPDGRYIAFESDYYSPGGKGQIYIMNIDGTNITHLVNIESGGPQWSPDSKRIIFQGYNEKLGIYVINTNGTNLEQLNNYGQEPDWSPSGNKIVFSGSYKTAFEIFTMNSDGSDTVLINKYGVCPSWSPDGSTIAYLSDRSGFTRIYLMDSDGKNIRILPTQAIVGCPKWSK